MHEKYTTRGIVVCSSAYREADKIISIYTEDFGLVSAVATGVRRAASKLRYHTQDYSVRQFSLVRGRDLWRLVGAEEIAPATDFEQPALHESLADENLAAYARILSLIRRLVRGEEKNEPVFRSMLSMYAVFPSMVSTNDVSALETLTVFRILHALGYIRSDASTLPLIAPMDIDQSLIALAKPLRSALVSAINSGLTESHL